MGHETWARVSLRIVSESLTAFEIDQLIGRKSSAKTDQLWAIDLTEDSAIGLDEQLQKAKEFLLEKADVLKGLAGSEVNLSIGWTPRSPQDGIILDTDLIQLLSKIRCYILLDTYVD